MTAIADAVAAHRAAWQAFQDAPVDDHHPEAMNAADAESEALTRLLRTVPQDDADLRLLLAHLDWWVAQRQDFECEPFALHAAITLALAVPK